jgi:hypothetical protein
MGCGRASKLKTEGAAVSTDKKGTRILARTFFAQLRAGGYTSNQILDIATELIDLVTTDLKEADQARSNEVKSPEHRLTA